MPILQWFKRHLPESFLALILVVLCVQNFSLNTYLIGWDNLMPELNIWLNLKRSLFAVWQQYQGLGLVGGMAHSADLVRQILILPLTLFLPQNLIRYLWHFSMLFLGTFGIYFFLFKKLKFKAWIAFCAALFYLLNFGSIQYFWVAFEPFSTFWGFFPWLISILFDYLKNTSKTNFKKLFFLNLLATPSFYVQTIFMVYIMCVGLIILSHFIFNFKFESTKRYFYIGLTLLFINSFWLLPQLYFLKNDVANTRLAFGNFMATEETVQRNQYRGTIPNFSILRGYYYDFPDSDSLLISPWVQYLSNNYHLYCGYLISVFVLIGLISLFTKKSSFSHLHLAFLLLFLLACITLLSATPPFEQINLFIRKLSFFDQVFRSPWTKFIVPAIFSFTVLIAYGLNTVTNLFVSLKYSSKIFPKILFSVYLFLLAVFSFPVFKGNYFSPRSRNAIPKEYFQLSNYFNRLPQTSRIANLPQGSFWGWTNYRWSTSGSGFIWYSIPQPILDRAFDVWNLKNEQYYWELSTVIQQKNPLALKSLIDKYSIEYLVFDNNIYFPDEKIYSKLSTPTHQLLDQIDGLKLDATFGRISIYKYNRPTELFLSPTKNDSPPIVAFNNSFQPNPSDVGQTIIHPISHSQLDYPKTSQIVSDTNFLYQLQNKLSHNLLAFNFPTLSLNNDYLLKIESRNLSGHPLVVSAFDNSAHYKYFLTKLPSKTYWQNSWYLIPKMETDVFNQGITILFDSPSFNETYSQNEIREPTVTQYNSGIPFINNYQSPNREYLTSKSNIFYYKTKISSSSLTNLVLPQSFHKGWIAFYFNKNKPVFLKNHSIFNGWANTWDISNINNKTIYIVFWPQVLEFFGFILLLCPLFWLLKPQNLSRHSHE